MESKGNSSNIKMQINNFTLNLQTLLSKDNQNQLSATKRKKSKTYRSNYDQSISPHKFKKKSKQKIVTQKVKKNHKKQDSDFQKIGSNLLKKNTSKNISNKALQQNHQGINHKENKQAFKKQRKSIGKKSRQMKTDRKVKQFQKMFTQYDQVIQSARLTTSPGLKSYNNNRFHSQSISKSASRQKSRSHNKSPFGTQSKQKKKRTKSTISFVNQKLNSHRQTQKVNNLKSQRKSVQRYIGDKKKKKKQKTKERNSIDNCARKSKSPIGQRLYTQNNQRSPLNDKKLNLRDILKQPQVISKKKVKIQGVNKRQNIDLASSQSQSLSNLKPKLATNKIKQKQKKRKKSQQMKIKQNTRKQQENNEGDYILQKRLKTQNKQRQMNKTIKTKFQKQQKEKKKIVYKSINSQQNKMSLDYLNQLFDKSTQKKKKKITSTTTNDKIKAISKTFNKQDLYLSQFNQFNNTVQKQQMVNQSAFKKKKPKKDQYFQQSIKININGQKFASIQGQQQPRQSQTKVKQQNPIKHKNLRIQTEFDLDQKKVFYFSELNKKLQDSVNQYQNRQSSKRSQKSIKEQIQQSRKNSIHSSRKASNLSSHQQSIHINNKQSIDSNNQEFGQITSQKASHIKNSDKLKQKGSLFESNQQCSNIKKQNLVSQISKYSYLQHSQNRQTPRQQSQIRKISPLELEQSESQNSDENSLSQKLQIDTKDKPSIHDKVGQQDNNNQVGQQDNELLQLYQMNSFLQKMISQNTPSNIKFQTKQQVKPKSSNLIANLKIKNKDNEPTCLSTTQIQVSSKKGFIRSSNLPQKRLPLVSPQSYASQNKQRIISVFNKKRLSKQDQMEIVRSLSNKRLIQQLQLMQTLQKSLQNSLILQNNHFKQDKIIEQKQQKQQQQKIKKKLIQQELKIDDYFHSNFSDYIPKSTLKNQILQSPININHSSDKDDSPLLSSNQQSSKLIQKQKQSKKTIEVDNFDQYINSHGQKEIYNRSDEKQKLLVNTVKEKGLIDKNQINKIFEQENFQNGNQDLDSSLSLYHQKNVLQIKKSNQYSHLSLQFQRQMQDYLKDSHQKSSLNQSKNKQKQSTNISKSQQFYYGQFIKNQQNSINQNNNTNNSYSELKSISGLATSQINKNEKKMDTQTDLNQNNHLESIKSQMISHILNTLLDQFTSFLNKNKTILHKFLYFVSNSNIIHFQEQKREQQILIRDPRQINQEQFKEYLQSRIQSSNQYIMNLTDDLFKFIKHNQENKTTVIKNINKSYGLKPLKTLKWMRKAFVENQEKSNNQQQIDSSEQSQISQSQQIQAVLSPSLLADFDAYQNQMVFQAINQEQYYLNHAVYAALNEVCDTLRPYGQSGPPVIPKIKPILNHSIQKIQLAVKTCFENNISLRMGRTSFQPDEQPQKIITQSYRKLQLMIVEQQHQKWKDRNLEDMIFQSEYYLALQIVDLIFNQQILQIFRLIY